MTDTDVHYSEVDDKHITNRSADDDDECDLATWKLGLLLAISYSLNYFWRYPIFMLPKGPGEILDTHGDNEKNPM